jgi:uncharacterized protein with von Willebrand factor type A (vWA) domain
MNKQKVREKEAERRSKTSVTESGATKPIGQVNLDELRVQVGETSPSEGKQPSGMDTGPG